LCYLFKINSKEKKEETTTCLLNVHIVLSFEKGKKRKNKVGGIFFSGA